MKTDPGSRIQLASRETNNVIPLRPRPSLAWTSRADRMSVRVEVTEVRLSDRAAIVAYLRDVADLFESEAGAALMALAGQA
jgi:hypothetical protein